MRRYGAALCGWLLSGALAVSCGSGESSPAEGEAGEAAGGTSTGSGATTADGGMAGGEEAAGGAPSATGTSAGASGAAGEVAAEPTGGAGGVPGADGGDLLFDAPGGGARAEGDLFRSSTGLVWMYRLGEKSFIATGAVTGGERVDLIESDEPITAFNVGSTIAYQTGTTLFSHALSTTPLTPVELEDAPSCVALASAAGNVYCRSTDGSIVRWADSGGTGTVLATGVPVGPDLVADAAPVNPMNRKLYFCEDAGAISSIPLGGVGGGVPMAPQYFQINKQESSPRGLRVGVPGDDVLYWINVPDGAPARVRGSAKTTPPVSSAGPSLENTRVFAPYSWSAGAIIAIELADDSAEIAFVRFGQSFITPHFKSKNGVVALAAELGHYYWLDRSARVFTGEP